MSRSTSLVLVILAAAGAAAAEPDHPPPTAPPPAPARVRRAPAATPVPGTVGLLSREIEVAGGCAPTIHHITRVRGGDDPLLVAAFTYPRLGELDFDPADQARAKRSLARFDAWMSTMKERFAAAIEPQRQRAFDHALPARARVEAAARVALLTDHLAELIETVDVPANIRTYQAAVDIFCDKLDEVAAPLRGQADQARAACARMIGDAGVGTGWWTGVCVVPAPAAPAPAAAPPP